MILILLMLILSFGVSLASAGSDLSITGTVTMVPSSASSLVFAKEANPVIINSVYNSGDPLTNIRVSLYASDVSGTVPINTTTIASLASGGTTSVTLIDPTLRSLEGGTVTYTAVVDPENLISETNESNNNKNSSAKSVKYNGYKGKRYWKDGSDITTKHTYDIQGNILYSTQPESVYQAVGWADRTETWTSGDLSIPSGSTVEKVWLYIAYNWDTTSGGVPDWNAVFNGNQLTGGTLYTDKSNFGGYADYKYGLYAFDVTGQFSSSGNNLVMTSNSGNSNALYPSTLVVVYSNPAETWKKIFINEECDDLLTDASKGISKEEATAYAPFTGMSFDLSKVTNASLYSFAASAGPGEGNLFFNGNSMAQNAWQGTGSSVKALVSNVKNYISATTNEAGIQETKTDGMVALQQILVVEYQQDAAPIANFTATVTGGTAPLTVQFNDQSTGSPTSWLWDFGDGTTATSQNVSHTYNTDGTFNVNLTVTGPGGSDSEVKTGYIVVSNQAAPVAAFTSDVTTGLAPLTVQFTDQSENSPSSWKWEYNSGSGWVQFSTEMNPSYSFEKACPYDIRLTASNGGGSNTETKLHYIATATGREPLSTVQSGIVSGDLYVSSPKTWVSSLSTWTSNPEVTQTFTLPVEAAGNIQWAKLYVNTYSGSAQNTYALISTVKLDGNGDGTLETTLGNETMDIASETNGNSYPLNDHINKIYSDYEAQYDVTGLISAANPTVNVKEQPISGKTLDGRIKGVTLIVAYNSSSSTNRTYYWVNHGSDWITNPDSGQTTFNTAGLTSGWSGAESKIRFMSTSDATSYTFNGVSKTGVSSTPNYDGLNTWDVTNNITAGQESTLAYTKTSGTSYKTTLATLKVKYPAQVAAPVTNFTAAPTSGNMPLTVQFTDASTGTASAYAWDFGDGNFSTDQNPSHTYNTAGTYNVNLTVTGPGGSNSMVKTGYIVVSEPLPAAPVANFAAAPTSGNAPLTVQFTDSSTGTVSAYAWDFNNDGVADNTTQNPLYTYSVPGTYNVNLTVTGSGGSDSEIKLNYITVSEVPVSAPVANFTATPIVGPAPLSVSFTDQSSNSPSSWKWEYNNGSGWTLFSTEKNPSFSFAIACPYDIRLTATNSGGSDDEAKLHYIAVATGREPLTTVKSGVVSGDLYISSPTTYATGVSEVTRSFTLPAAAIGNIQWAKLYVNTYSGSSANTHALTSTVKLDGNGDGTFESTLGNETMDIASETNGNSYPLNDHVNKVYSDYEARYDVSNLIYSISPVVNVKSQAISGKIFDGRIKGITLIVAYNDSSSTNRTYYWINHGGDWIGSNGTGQTSFNTDGLPGGWASAESKIRHFASKDVYDYTFNGVSKTGGGSSISNYSGLNTWDVTGNINIGQSSILAYSNPISSSYKTTLATLIVRYVSQVAAPIANFSAVPTSGNVPLTVQFTDASTGTVSSYTWDFGDGNYSTDQNPSHTYNTAGTYNVNLTVTGPGGSNSMVKTEYIVVSEPLPGAPVANFTAAPTSGIVPLTVQFTDASTGTVSGYAWNFGDGNYSTDQTPSHIYGTPGTYDVNLTVTGPGGSDSEVKTGYIVVNGPLQAAPVAAFAATPVSGDVPLTVQFTDQSTGTPTSWFWDFGDGTNTTDQNVTHTYTSTGTYIANLTVGNANGTDSTSASITVTEKNTPVLPIANFSANLSEGYAPLSVQFTDMSENAGSLIWDFGDGANSTEQNPVHTYSEVGNYTVNLTVSNGNGTDSKFAAINVFEKSAPVLPLANFSCDVTEGYAPLSVQFSDLSENATGISWDFGDGANSTEKSPLHTFNTVGNYTVNLTVSNENGTASMSTAITVLKQPAVLPVANFSSDIITGSAPLSVQFTDLSKDATAWNWDFGDGAKSTEQNPVHTYNASGTYTVTLTVSNEAGTDNETKTGYIKVTSIPSKLAAAFTASPYSGNAPLKVAFTDKSTGSPTSWKWSFGDGTYSTARNPVHTYSKAGKYTVTLTVKNTKYSSSVTKKSFISVKNFVKPPVAAFTASPCSGNAPLKVAFTDKSKGSPTSWKWSFGDGTYSNSRNPVHTYSKAGKYTVSLTVKNSAGICTVTGYNYIKVSAPLKPPVAAFSASPTSGKTPLKVNFVDKSSGTPTAWMWSFGDGTYSTAKNPVHIYTKAGKYTVTLTAKNAKGSSTKKIYGCITVSKK